MDDEYFGRAAEGTSEAAASMDTDIPDDTEAPPDSAAAHLTLAAIEQQTGISYVSLQRYAQQFGDRLPHEGTGRNRRYYPAAVEEFRKIREEMSQRRSGNLVPSTESGALTKQATRRSKSKAAKARRRKGASAGKKLPRKVAAGLIPSKLTEAVSRSGFRSGSVGAPKEFSGSFPETKAATASPDLDRLAKIYQFRLQLKTLDEVTAFVADWRALVESAIKELEP